MCRCGHGRVFHRASRNAALKRRRLGLKPTGHLPCEAWVRTPGATSSRDGRRCGCRNFVPKEA